MSAFSGFEAYGVAMNTTIKGVHTTLKAALTAYNWQVIGESADTTPATLDVIPPSDQLVGNSQSIEFIRFSINTSAITILPCKKYLTGLGQVFALYESGAGTTLNSVTIDGVTVSQAAGSNVAGNTAKQNLRLLYNALKSSTDAKVKAFAYRYCSAPALNGETTDAILAYSKTPVANVAITNAGTTRVDVGSYQAPNAIQASTLGNIPTVSIDLSSGFIYFLTATKRSITFSTKTNTNYYGPVHAVYGDHAQALSNMEQNNPFITPIELFIGWDTGTYQTRWCTANYHAMRNAFLATAASGMNPGRCVQGGILRNILMDCQWPSNTNNGSDYIQDQVANTLLGSGMFSSTGTDVSDEFQLHKMIMRGPVPAYTTSFSKSTGVVPAVFFDDWQHYVGATTNETLILSVPSKAVTALATAIGADSVSSLVLSDASTLPSSGFVAIDGECFQYTGKSSNTLNGVTRSMYGTTARDHGVGEDVYLCSWSLKINYGAHFCGYQKPS